jgi:anti-anti-sigma factor
VVLEIVAGRAPEPWEVEQVVGSLGRHGTLDRVTVDLSQLAVINSSFLAALVGMKKRLQPFGCTLFLRGLRPIVREIFDRLRLNRYFRIVKSEEHVAVCA